MILVSHPTKQGNVYERAYAAQIYGFPVRYLTGFYGAHPPATLRVAGALPRFRSKYRALLAKRTHPRLDVASVLSVSSPWLEIGRLLRIGTVDLQYRIHDRAAARWLRRASLCAEKSVVHAFQGSAFQTLKCARALGFATVLEVTLPPMRQMDVAFAPEEHGFRRSLSRENEQRRDDLLKEAGMADWIIVQSDYGRRVLMEHGVPGGRIILVELGVDTTRFQPIDRPASDRLRLFFGGQIGYRKGIDLIDQVVCQLKSSSFEFVAAGHVVDRIGEEVLRRNSLIQYRGVVSDDAMVRCFQRADAAFVPSRAEGGCNVIMEAMACGAPCIVTEGAASIIDDGNNGFVARNGDVDALVKAVNRMIADREMTRRMGVCARRSATNHSWEAFYSRLAAVYREVLDAATR